MSLRVLNTSSGGLPDERPTGELTRLFAQPLYVGRPNLGDRAAILARINTALDEYRLTNQGPLVEKFESRIARFLGARHCITVANATIGLQLVIHALGLAGEVIVPSFTFPATVHALAWQRVRPVFCDVDPNTHNLDAAQIERLIGPDTSAILAVHLWGNPGPIESLVEIADRHNLVLLFDAAHAFACSHRGRMIGNFGRAEVFSFHATKFISTGEGGAVTTNDDDLARRLRQLRCFGLDGDLATSIGINAKLSELAAALGLSALESCDDFVRHNHANLAAYRNELAGIPGLTLFAPPTPDERNAQYIVVEVDPLATGLSRDKIVAALHYENVHAKRYFFPGCHRLEPYRASHEDRRHPLPHTERLCAGLLQLPTGTAVSPHDIAKIGDFLRRLTARARRAA